MFTSIFIYNLSQLYFGQSVPSSYLKNTLIIVWVHPGSNKSLKLKTPLKMIYVNSALFKFLVLPFLNLTNSSSVIAGYLIN